MMCCHVDFSQCIIILFASFDVPYHECSYVAAHVRRGDFPNYARKQTTPSLDIAAASLRIVAASTGAKHVFICTDGSAEEKETLKKNLAPEFVAHFLEEDQGI